MDVRLARLGIDVETEPHALSHTTKPTSGTAMSNGEVEGPHAGARLEPWVHTVFQHPRRHYRDSRPPPTIVRRHPVSGMVDAVKYRYAL
jgi:hypothetical protein